MQPKQALCQRLSSTNGILNRPCSPLIPRRCPAAPLAASDAPRRVHQARAFEAVEGLSAAVGAIAGAAGPLGPALTVLGQDLVDVVGLQPSGAGLARL